MPRAALSTAEIDAFRSRLCEVATKLFAERGYASVTFRALAAELGCSPMTPYRYFRGKDDILAAARQIAYRRFGELQERAYAMASDPIERVKACCRVDFRLGLESPDVYKIMFEINQPSQAEFPDLVREIERSYRSFRASVEEAIQQGLLAGDVDIVAHTIWAGVHGVVSLHLSGVLTILGRSALDLMEPMLEALIEGHRPRPATAGRGTRRETRAPSSRRSSSHRGR
jgi:AcrR family transcriptional regulator